jgi:hypothetical protein
MGPLRLVLLSALLATAALAGEPELPFVRVANGEQSIAIDQVVGDLLVVDGRVEIAGVVRGHVYAIDSEVAVRSSGVVLRPITLARGALHIEDGAVLPKTIDLLGSELFGPSGESVPGSGKLVIQGATEVMASGPPSAASLAIMKSTIPFDRFTPPADMEIADLRGWHPELGLELKKFIEAPTELLVGGVTKLSFVSDKVVTSFQRGYRGPRGSVLFTGVRLVDDDAASELWKQIETIRPRVDVSLSVRSDLGPGAHWFYRHKGRYCLLWQSGSYFLAVETRLEDGGASILQQKQFNEQVLDALRRSLEQLRSLPQGAVP